MTKCKDHPKYKGIRSPRVECFACLNIYMYNLNAEMAKTLTEIGELEKELKWWEENWDEEA